MASVLNAMTRSLVGPSFDAFIADNSAPENRARLFGITQTLFGIVSVVGPLAGGYLVEAMGFKGMLLIATILYVLATVLRVGMARTAAKGKGSQSHYVDFYQPEKQPGRHDWSGTGGRIIYMDHDYGWYS